jgi:hypothetical protein
VQTVGRAPLLINVTELDLGFELARRALRFRAGLRFSRRKFGTMGIAALASVLGQLSVGRSRTLSQFEKEIDWGSVIASSLQLLLFLVSLLFAFLGLTKY